MPYPKVSVIMPTCNRPLQLAQAIASVLGQSEQSFELIIINDGGDDIASTLIAFTDSRIKTISHTKSRGQSAARNTGLNAARGEFVAYLDDDDVYYPEHLETLLKNITKEGAAYSEAWRVLRDEAGREIGRDKPFGQNFNREDLLITNFIPLLCIMHSRNLLDKAGLFDENLNVLEDWDLIIRLSLHCNFLYVAAVTAEYNKVRGQSSVTNRGHNQSLEVTETIHARYQMWANEGVKHAQKLRSAIIKTNLGGQSRFSSAELAKLLIEDGELCFNAGDIKRAHFFFEQSLMLDADNAQALNNLGVLAWQQDNADGAIRLFLRSLKSDPANQEALDNLSLCQAISENLPTELKEQLAMALNRGQD